MDNPFFSVTICGTCLCLVLTAHRNYSEDSQRKRKSDRFFTLFCTVSNIGKPYVNIRTLNEKNQTKSAHKRFSEASWWTFLN